jgi:SAM-dependent methyltransferase
MAAPPPQPETIARLFDAVYPSFAMLAGMQLDLFTQLADGPLNTEEIADTIGVPAFKLRPLLYALVVAGLLRIQKGSFANTLEADHYLVSGKPTYMGGLKDLTANNWARTLKTAETIRAGGPQESYDYHAPSEDEIIALFRGLYPGAVADAYRLMDHHDFSSCETLLDVGGGSGALAITLAQVNPRMKVTVAELPSVTPITRQFVEEADVDDRVDIVAADAVRDTLSGPFDVIVARHVVQVLSADDSRALLKNFAAAVRPGGAIHLIGWVLDNSRLTPQNTVGYNLILLNCYEDGQAYTEEEYYEWLADAGFEDFERIVFTDGASIVSARKPPEA